LLYQNRGLKTDLRGCFLRPPTPSRPQFITITISILLKERRRRHPPRPCTLTLVVFTGRVQRRRGVVRGDHLDVVHILFLAVEHHNRGYVTGVRVNGEIITVVGQLVRYAVVGHARVGVDCSDLHHGGAGRFVLQNGTGHDLGEHRYVVVYVFHLDVQLVFGSQVVLVLMK